MIHNLEQAPEIKTSSKHILQSLTEAKDSGKSLNDNQKLEKTIKLLAQYNVYDAIGEVSPSIASHLLKPGKNLTGISPIEYQKNRIKEADAYIKILLQRGADLSKVLKQEQADYRSAVEHGTSSLSTESLKKLHFNFIDVASAYITNDKENTPVKPAPRDRFSYTRPFSQPGVNLVGELSATNSRKKRKEAQLGSSSDTDKKSSSRQLFKS